MAVTDSTTGFVTHQESDVITPISTYVNDVVTPINTWALDRMRKNYVWANSTARTAQTGMVGGSRGFQTDTRATYVYVSASSTWILEPESVMMMTRNATQSIATGLGSGSVVNFDTAVMTDGSFTVASGVFTCVTAGTYKINTYINWALNATGNRYVAINKNATSSPYAKQTQAASATASAGFASDTWVILSLAATDTIRINADQSSGGALNITTAGIEFIRVA